MSDLLICSETQQISSRSAGDAQPGFKMEEIPGFQHDLPLDLVYYILLGVPVKTLCRFRCVSKLWCSLISHPHFQREHYRRSQRSPLLFVTNDNRQGVFSFSTHDNQGSFIREFSNGYPDFSAPIKQDTFDVKVIQSCLGLVCFRVFFDRSIRLCNPSTEEMIVLPECSKEQFDICLGFGYTDSTEEYKVVRFFQPDPCKEETSCEVFTLGTNGAWREARSPPYLPRYNAHLPYLHGALHLLPDQDLEAQEDQYIAAFDVDTEEYRGLPFPEIYFRQGRSEIRSDFIQLAALGGTLCLTFAFINTKKMLELWYLKEYHGGRWVKQYSIDLSSESCFHAYPLATMFDGSILLKLFQKNDSVRSLCSSVLCLYNTHDNSFAETKAIDSEATFYIESFVPLGNRGNHHMDID